MQGSDTSYSSKSSVEEGSQGVALGQVTYFTSLICKSRCTDSSRHCFCTSSNSIKTAIECAVEGRE